MAKQITAENSQTLNIETDNPCNEIVELPKSSI